QGTLSPCHGTAEYHFTHVPGNAGTPRLMRWFSRSATQAQVVELAILGPDQEGLDLGPGIDQGRSGRVPGVADRDRVAVQLSELDAAAARVAGLALAPPRRDQPVG